MTIEITLKKPENSFLNFDSLGKSHTFKLYQRGINKLKKFIDTIPNNATYSLSDYLILDNTKHYCSFIIEINHQNITEKQIIKIKLLIQEHIFDTIAYRNKIFNITILQIKQDNTLKIGIVFI